MEAAIETLIEAARSGGDEAVDALAAAVARRRDGAILTTLASSAEIPLRQAAARAVAGFGPGVPEALLESLARDPEAGVRLDLAAALAARGGTPSRVAALLLEDGDGAVRIAAVALAEGRVDLEEKILLLLASDDEEEVRVRAARALAHARPDRATGPLLEALASDDERSVSAACAESLERLVPGGPGGDRPRAAVLETALSRVQALGRQRFPALSAWLEQRIASDVDVEALREYGSDLTAEAEAGRLPRAFETEGVIEPLLKVLRGGAPRAAVLLGESGVGKTAAAMELVHRLRAEGWRVLRVSPAELLAGTKYLGEWETKVRDLIRAVRAPKKVLLYVPNVEQLATAGTTSKSDANVATFMAPHIESGAIALLGESTVEAFRRGLGQSSSLRRLFTPLELQPASAAATRRVLEAVCLDAGFEPPEGTLDLLLELGDLYFPGVAHPGRAVGLLRRVLPPGGAPLTRDGIFAALTESTGMPRALLDDAQRLDLDEWRGFFASRVMGQPEAVETVVDVVALLKAGLNDPQKPPAVLLFIGPTGVGKTELARALAERLFGDPGRLRRFDMSEFANYDAFERLLGKNGEPGLLTAAVREQPFSVILLDEVEKAHVNVFDLCLQIFDAGRLTDAAGRTADFRRAIVVLTSNIGSSVPTESTLGFGGAVPAAPDRESVLRELRRFFRPEFLNRLDRIVSFRPLSLETAQQIARRELARVLERSGIARRRLAVDVDPAVEALLLKQGYSPAFGARPLKRTVERLVLLPVARAIAEGAVPVGSTLRLGAEGDSVRVRLLRGDAEEVREEAKGEERAKEGRAELLARFDALLEGAAPLRTRRDELLAGTRGGRWNDPARLDEIHRLDGLLKQIELLRRRAAGGATEELGREAARLERLAADPGGPGLLDAFLAIRRVKTQGKGLDGVTKLASMYRAFAARRGFECETLDDRSGDEDTVLLLVAGVGAFDLLRHEEGLHQLSRGSGRHREERDLVSVSVHAAPDDTPFAPKELKVSARSVRGKGRFGQKLSSELDLLHLPTLTSLRARSGLGREAALKALSPLLRALLAPASPAAPEVTRRYVLGASPMVRDRRTGARTGRVDRVLAGELELVLR